MYAGSLAPVTWRVNGGSHDAGFEPSQGARREEKTFSYDRQGVTDAHT